MRQVPSKWVAICAKERGRTVVRISFFLCWFFSSALSRPDRCPLASVPVQISERRNVFVGTLNDHISPGWLGKETSINRSFTQYFNFPNRTAESKTNHVRETRHQETWPSCSTNTTARAHGSKQSSFPSGLSKSSSWSP